MGHYLYREEHTLTTVNLTEVGAASGEAVVTGKTPVADFLELGDAVGTKPALDLLPLIFLEMPMVDESVGSLRGGGDGEVV